MYVVYQITVMFSMDTIIVIVLVAINDEYNSYNYININVFVVVLRIFRTCGPFNKISDYKNADRSATQCFSVISNYHIIALIK